MSLHRRLLTAALRQTPLQCTGKSLDHLHLAPPRRTLTTSAKPAAEPFKVLFCGSDEFSTAALQAVLQAEDVWQSITVLTPRNQRVARGNKATYVAPLKLFAQDRGLTIHDVPATGLKDGFQFPGPFTEHHPAHLLLTASFGHIIPTQLLSPFAHALNVHPSLLPKYRGAAPVQWAIANGDTSTGVSVQTVGAREVGVDSGAILGAVGNVPIPADATYPTLLPTLSNLGGQTLVAVLRQLLRGDARPHAQDASQVTRAPKITLATAKVDWNTGAAAIERAHRAFAHHRPLWTSSAAGDVQLLDLSLADDVPRHAESHGTRGVGTAVLDRKGKRVLVLSGEGWVEVRRVKSAGRKALDVHEWWNGLPKGERERDWVSWE